MSLLRQTDCKIKYLYSLTAPQTMTKIVLGAAFICFSHSGKNFKLLRLNPQTIQKKQKLLCIIMDLFAKILPVRLLPEAGSSVKYNGPAC